MESKAGIENIYKNFKMRWSLDWDDEEVVKQAYQHALYVLNHMKPQSEDLQAQIVQTKRKIELLYKKK